MAAVTTCSDFAAAAAQLLQSCPTLCDPIDGSPPGSPIPGILQARTLEWGAISFSNAWKWKEKVKSFSPFRLFATPWTAANQPPPSMGFFQGKSTRVGCHFPLCSDFEAPKNKVCHCFHCFHIYLPRSDGTRCQDLSFLNVEFEANFFTPLSFSSRGSLVIFCSLP